MISARITAHDGASSDGFRIIVSPAARAGATFAQIWFSGQFHGVIIATTPSGSCTTVALPMTSENSNAASAFAVAEKCASPVGACAIEASAIGAPISCDIALARSGIRALYSVMIRPSTSSRSCTLVWLQFSNAERAAATALSTSAAVPSVISVQGCSVDGSIT